MNQSNVSTDTHNIVSIVDVQLQRNGSLLFENMAVNSPSSGAHLLRTYLGDKDREHFVLVALNTKGYPTHIQTVHIGNISSSVVSPREIFKVAILANAGKILIGHNHPSGETKPSREDIDFTERMAQAGHILGIQLLDHIIISHDGHYSMKEHNQF